MSPVLLPGPGISGFEHRWLGRAIEAGWTEVTLAARELEPAEGTVKNHVSTFLDTVRAASRVQAAQVARDAGLS